MSAHLRPLPRCDCGRPATEALYNAAHAVNGFYCDRHAKQALRDHQRRFETANREGNRDA